MSVTHLVPGTLLSTLYNHAAYPPALEHIYDQQFSTRGTLQCVVMMFNSEHIRREKEAFIAQRLGGRTQKTSRMVPVDYYSQ